MAYLAIKDTLNSKKYGEMAVKVNKKYGDGWILLGDIEALKDDGGAAAQQYQQAIYFDPQNPQGYIKYAWVYRGRSPQQAVEQLEQLRTIKPDYPVDAEAGHIYYLANNREKAKEYYSKVDPNKLDKSMHAHVCLPVIMQSARKWQPLVLPSTRKTLLSTVLPCFHTMLQRIMTRLWYMPRLCLIRPIR